MRAFAAVVAGIVLVLPPTALGQDANKFVGTWASAAKVAGFDHHYVITRDGDAWSLTSTYWKNKKQSGSGVGKDVKVTDGILFFHHKLIEKPTKSWADTTFLHGLRWKGDRLELYNASNNKHERYYERISGPAVAQANPKPDVKNPPAVPTPMAQPDPDVPTSFDGIWMGEIPSSKMTLLLKITKGPSKKGDQAVVEAFLTDDGKFKGHFHSPNLRFDTAKGSELHVNQAWDNTPGVSRAGFAKLSLLRAKGGLVLTGTGLTPGTSTALLKAVDASEIAKLPSPPPPPMVVAKSRGDSGNPAAPGDSVGPKTKSVKAVYTLERPAPLPKIAPTPIEATLVDKCNQIRVSALRGRVSVVGDEASMIDIDSRKNLWKVMAQNRRAAELSPDGKLVAYAAASVQENGLKHLMEICDADNGKLLRTLEGHNIGPFHPTEPCIVRYESKQVALVDLKTGKEKWTIPVGLSADLRFDPTGHYCVITFNPEGKVTYFATRVYDAETGMMVVDLAEKSSTQGGSFSPDGKRVALYCSAYYRGAVKIFDVETGKEVCSTPSFPARNVEQHHPLDFVSDGNSVAVCCADKTLRFYDAATGQLKRFHAIDEQPDDVYALNDNDRVVTANHKGVRIYRIASAVTPAQAASQGAPPAPVTEPPNP